MTNRFRTLYTIFNRNDPTPTANALRKLAYQNAVVIVLNREGFNPSHQESLARFETWLTGSPRCHLRGRGKQHEWPDRYWKQQWGWDVVDVGNVQFLEATEITSELVESIHSNDVVDLTSGTKAQCVSLIQELHRQNRHPDIVLQTQDNRTLNINSGEITTQSTPLSFRERVWLASGYIVDFEVFGDPAIGEAYIGTRKVKNRGKVLPDSSEISRRLHREVDLNHGAWLEEAATHMMSTWTNVTESYLGPRLIKPSYSRAAGAGFFTLVRRVNREPQVEDIIGVHKDRILKISQIDDYEKRTTEAFEFLSRTVFTQSQIQCIQHCLHSIEFDSIAFDGFSGNAFVVECKSKRRIEPGVLGRIFAITRLVLPTTGVPMLVYCGTKSRVSNGVLQIAWPELATERILSSLPMTTKAPAKKTNGRNEQPPQKQQLHEDKASQPQPARRENLRPLLNEIRADPRTWAQFVVLVQNEGIRAKGLWKKLQKLADHFGIELNPKNRKSADWICWKER